MPLTTLTLLTCCGDGSADFRRAAALGFESPRVAGGAVPFVAMARWGGGQVLTVYVEGDGRAWSLGAPPDNPTPRTPVGLELALAIVGRRCSISGGPASSWRSVPIRVRRSCRAGGRFGAVVIEAMDGAVVDAERRSGARALVLVGFSGGAAVAALLALRHPETALLVTVAGVVDPAAWTKLHGVAPLAESLNPAERLAALARISQVHLVGRCRRYRAPGAGRGLVARYPPGAPARVESTADHHDCCWQDGWAARIGSLRDRAAGR